MLKTLIPLILRIYPILINLLILIIIATPSKKIKFNPINFLLLLIIFTLILSLKINFLINSWRSYILFLIIIGGLIIIFIYITSLSNNEISYLNLKIIYINFFKVFPLILIITLIFIFFINLEINNLFIWNLNYKKNYNSNFFEIFINFYNFNNLFIINYLFYRLICIINICYKFKLPLRQIFF